MTVLETLIEACEACERDALRVADRLDEWALEIRIGTGLDDPLADLERALRLLAADLRADDRRRMAIELGRMACARPWSRGVLPAGPMPDCDG